MRSGGPLCKWDDSLGMTNDKPVSLDDFDSHILVCHRQTYDCCVQVIVDQFLKQRGGVVAEKFDLRARHNSLCN